jgi:hypothetical protein
MNTIKATILRNALPAARERLAKLTEMSAPQAILDGIAAEIAELEQGNIKIGGDQSLLELSAEGGVWKTGRSGKGYVEFANGVKYFPQARYGKFISR